MVTKIKNNEEIDAIVKTKLAQFSRNGGKAPIARWSEEELEIVDAVIWDLLTVGCLSREQTAQELSKRWGVTVGTARKYIQNAIKRLAGQFEEDTETKRKMFLEKCESILEQAIADGQKRTALQALDTIAKASGFYKETKEIDITGDGAIKFDFS